MQQRLQLAMPCACAGRRRRGELQLLVAVVGPGAHAALRDSAAAHALAHGRIRSGRRARRGRDPYGRAGVLSALCSLLLGASKVVWKLWSRIDVCPGRTCARLLAYGERPTRIKICCTNFPRVTRCISQHNPTALATPQQSPRCAACCRES